MGPSRRGFPSRGPLLGPIRPPPQRLVPGLAGVLSSQLNDANRSSTTPSGSHGINRLTNNTAFWASGPLLLLAWKVGLSNMRPWSRNDATLPLLFPFPFHSVVLPPSPSRICSGLTRGCLGQRPASADAQEVRFETIQQGSKQRMVWALASDTTLDHSPTRSSEACRRSARPSQTRRSVLVRRQTGLDDMARAHQGHRRRTRREPATRGLPGGGLCAPRWVVASHRPPISRGTVSAGRRSLCRRTGIDQKRTAAFGKPRYVTQRLTHPRWSLQDAVWSRPLAAQRHMERTRCWLAGTM